MKMWNNLCFTSDAKPLFSFTDLLKKEKKRRK